MLIWCRPKRRWCDADLRIMACKIFFSFLEVGRKPSFAQLVFNLSTVSVPVFPFQVDAGTMLYRADCDVHLQTNEDW